MAEKKERKIKRETLGEKEEEELRNPSAFLSHMLGRIAEEGVGNSSKGKRRRGEGSSAGRGGGPGRGSGPSGGRGYAGGRGGSTLSSRAGGMDMGASSGGRGGGRMSNIFPSMGRGRGRGRGYM